MNAKIPRVILGWLGGSITTAALLLTFLAKADGSIVTDGVPALVPYEGRLERDGAALDEDLDMTFRIWDGVTLRWSERRTVPIVAGRFTALLGDTSSASGVNLAAALKKADSLELDVVLHTTSGDVTLEGRRPLSAAPYAILAGSAVDAQVGGQLVVEADETLSASTTGGFVLTDNDGKILSMDGDEINSSDTLYLNRASGKDINFARGVTTTGKLTFASSASGDGGTAMSYNAATNTLTINPGGVLGKKTVFDGNTWLNDNVVGLDASMTSTNDSGSCVTFDLGLTSGTLTQYCPDKMAMVGGTWGGSTTGGGKGLQFMRCCPFELWVN